MAHISLRYNNKTTNIYSIVRIPSKPVSRSGGNIASNIIWDDMRIAELLAAYHVGFCICFPIFHSYGDRLGPTWVVGIAGAASALLNILTPPSAYNNFWILFFVRIIIGFCAGAMQPSMVQLLRHWVPPTERNHFMWAYCGITTGTCVTFLMCALVHYYSHWTVGFYIAGTIQLLWSILWLFIITDSPSKHPFISHEELTYLNNTIGTVFTIKVTNAQTPWIPILKSGPFWALCILNFGYAWMIISLGIHGPLYYTLVVKYSIYSAAALTALPFAIRLILGTVVIHLFYWYKHHADDVTRVKTIRKYCIVVSHVIPGIIIAGCWLFPLIPGPGLLSLAVALTAAGMDLTLDLSYELTPNFAQSITTLCKILGNTPGIIVAFCVGQVTKQYGNSPFIWKQIWCFHGLILSLSGLIYLIWGETTIQPWNKIQSTRIRRYHAMPKTSMMSNITEVSEDISVS